MKSIVADKIFIARKRCRLSMDQLVARMGDKAVSKMAISKIERGLMQPSLSTLQAIADACMMPIDYFYKEEVNVGQINFRFDPITSAKEASQIKTYIISAIQEQIDKLLLEPYTPFENPMSNVTLRNYTDAERASVKLRKKWEIGLQPIFSVYELMQNYGIQIIELALENQNIDGLSTWANNAIPAMIMNTSKHKTTERKRFTALHELGHLLFKLKPMTEIQHEAYLSTLSQSNCQTIIKRPTEERLCNYFAGAMLLPEESLKRRIGTFRTEIDIDELISIRNMYGVSIASIVHRLHDLRIIDEKLYNHLFDKVIKKNKMEIGWGDFPIKEKAETIRIKI